MLVLSRKKDEDVVIAGGLITVKIIEIRGDKVRLGFVAPKDVDIYRKEIFDAIQKGNECSSTSSLSGSPCCEGHAEQTG
jgi:carbon storage regulator